MCSSDLGGHGTAAAMGESFRQLGFDSGQDLGLAMATVGLLASTIVGSALVVLGRWRGWVKPAEEEPLADRTGAVEEPTTLLMRLRILALNLGFAGCAVGIGELALQGLRLLSPWLGEGYRQVMTVFPVFPLALLGSLLVRLSLERLERTAWVSQILQRELATLATDLLIIAAMAALNLPQLAHDWLPITLLSLVGLAWNLVGILVVAPRVIADDWFERAITEYGQATGVAASGLLLLRLVDPLNRSSTLPVFSLKQLVMQPVLSGGIVTVIAPLAVQRLGLLGWTELCGLLTIVWIGLALLLRHWPEPAAN